MSISKTIITTVLALAMVAVVAPSAMALTAGCSLTNTATCNLQDLTTLISGLTSQLTSLQGTSGTTGAGACVGVTFTRNLYVGNTGSDVSCLQQIVGSTVVGTYGPNTKAHVVTFQTAHGITATGSVGPRTIAALTLAMGGSTGAGAGSGSGSTGLCPNGMTLASNCTTGANNTPVGGIGFLSIPELAATPASNANVTTTTNVPVLGVDVKAIGSDMVVNSAKVQLAATKNSAVEHPATTVQALYVYDGSTKIGTYPVNTTTVIKDGSSYYVILSGFSFRVPGNTTRTLTINADFAPSLETSRVLKVALYGTTDAIGATDGSGVNRSAGLDASLSSGIPTANYKQYTVAYATVNTSTLAATANTSTPVAASVKIDSTNGTTDVPMLVFDTKSTTGASVITDVTVTATGDAAGIAAVNAVKLYDGNTLLGSLSLTAAKAHFTNLTINVPQDS